VHQTGKRGGGGQRSLAAAAAAAQPIHMQICKSTTLQDIMLKIAQ